MMIRHIAHAGIFAICCIVAVARAQTQPATRRGGPQDLAASRLLFDSWKLPIPPKHLIGNINYVGAFNVSSYLITTPQGHILIDTTFEEVVPQIEKNIAQLGFRVQDIKYILSSHAHVDHTGGHALMKKLSGAQIVASAADAHIMETGGDDDFSPFPKVLLRYTPVKADRIIKDGEQVALGDVTLTAHLTPGHTKGATTWTMKTEEGGKPYDVLFFSSVSIVQGTKLVGNTDYPTIAEDYEATYAKLKTLPCDVFLAPHGDQFGMSQKLARLGQPGGNNPFIDPDVWKRNLAQNEASFRRQLASERAAAGK